MQISTKDWKAYIVRLSALDKAAGDQMLRWIQRNGFGDTQALLDFAYSLVTKYGEGSAALAAQMYDAIAEMQHAAVEAAVPAATATYGETAAAIQGTIKRSENPDMIASTTERLVKQAGADTMVQNAKRDGAYFAWIPSGDTCPFCLMLASNGWQKASKKTIKGDHAEHIHANCNCNFAIRFDNSLEVEGYDPEKYKARYDAAEGDTWQEKINDMRRVDYGQHKDEINAQKRAAYAARERRDKRSFFDVLDEYMQNATPGEGIVTLEENRKVKGREESNAILIRNTFGGNITLCDDSDRTQTNPDYFWKGKRWEEQELAKDSKNAIDQNTREAIHQIQGRDHPGGIILDISVCETAMNDIRTIVKHRLDRSSKIDCDVIFIKGSRVEGVFRYKK